MVSSLGRFRKPVDPEPALEFIDHFFRFQRDFFDKDTAAVKPESFNVRNAYSLHDAVYIHYELVECMEIKIVVLDPVDQDKPEIARYVVFS